MIDELDLLTLDAPAGNGQTNDPADIAALDNSLRRIEAYAPPPEYAREPQRYATEPMIRALEKFQEQNGLKIDGYANPAGPTERAINNRLLEKPKGAGLLFDPPAPLSGTVGNSFENRRGDVATVQRMLGALGEMPEDPFDRPHGIIDENTTGAIKSFQRRRGLTEDGWLGPGGETERAIHEAVADLARAKGRDWLRFAERAGQAQARSMQPLSTRFGAALRDKSEPIDMVSVAWPRTSRTQPDGETAERPAIPPASDDEVRVEPAQAGDIIVPPLLWLLGALGAGVAAKKHLEDQAKRSAEAEPPPVGKTELIPPQVDDEPFRGPDPMKPPLDPKLTRPAPHPSESPYKPEQERIAPTRIDPRDFIEILPDQSDWIAHLPIIVENRQGFAPVKALNRALGKPVIGIGQKVFPDAKIVQTGGPTPNAAKDYSEEFDQFRDKEKFGITSNAGGSFKDVSYLFEYNGVKFKVVINTVTTTGANVVPTSREDRQRAKMVLNARTHTLIIDVDKLQPNETIDWRAWDGFLESRLRYVKWLIDKKIVTSKNFDHRLLDKFNKRMRQ
jgi:hypothetical protein